MDKDSGAEEDTNNGHVGSAVSSQIPTREGVTNGTHETEGRISELLEEEIDDVPTPEGLGSGIHQYGELSHIDDVSEDDSSDALPRRAQSPVDSIPDDSPSVQVTSVVRRLNLC